MQGSRVGKSSASMHHFTKAFLLKGFRNSIALQLVSQKISAGEKKTQVVCNAKNYSRENVVIG